VTNHKPEPSNEDAEDVLDAFNAEDAIERPGRPPRKAESPVNDTEVQPPG